MNYASIHNYYWDFEKNYAVLKRFSSLGVKPVADFEFSANIIREYPQLTENLDMSAYSFKQYFAEVDNANSYTLSPAETITYKDVNNKEGTIGAEGHKILKSEIKNNQIYAYVVAEYGVYKLENKIKVYKDVNKKSKILNKQNSKNQKTHRILVQVN